MKEPFSHKKRSRKTPTRKKLQTPTEKVASPLDGLFSTAPDTDRMGTMLKRSQDHLYAGDIDERSFTPGGKDERALLICRFLSERFGSQVFGAVATAAERIRISRDWKGRNDDVAVMQAEIMRELELRKAEAIEKRLTSPDRR
jgi:hypothetical protein